MRALVLMATLAASVMAFPVKEANAGGLFQCFSMRSEIGTAAEHLKNFKNANAAVAAMFDSMIRSVENAPEAKKADVQANNMLGLIIQCGLMHGYDVCLNYATVHDQLLEQVHSKIRSAQGAGC